MENFQDNVFGGGTHQHERVDLDCQPHVIHRFFATLLELLIGLLGKLHVEQVGTIDGVGPDLADGQLTADVTRAEVDDRVVPDSFVLYLLLVVLDYLVDLLAQP